MAMSRVKAIAFSALLLLTILMSTINTSAEDQTWEAGFVEWMVEDTHRLYVEGNDTEDSVLQRSSPDSVEGRFTMFGTPGSQLTPVFSLTSPPIVNPINASISMSVFFSAILENSPERACTSLNPLTLNNAPTVFNYVVSVSGNTIYDQTVSAALGEVAEGTSQLYEGEFVDMNLSMAAGESFTLTVSMSHSCPGTSASMLWGGQEQNAGGIVLVGDFFKPRVEMSIDSQNIPHITFYPETPWGEDDIAITNGKKGVNWWIYAPVRVNEYYATDPDLQRENSLNRGMGERILPSGEKVWTWTGTEKLPDGLVNLEVCVAFEGSDILEPCHARGNLRAETPMKDSGFANSALILGISSFVCLVAFIANGFRQGLLLPIPIMVALILLAAGMLPLAFIQPNLGSDASIDQSTRIYEMGLVDSQGNEVKLSDLLKGHDALLIGTILPASENALDQKTEFMSIQEKFGDSVAIVQIVTGQDSYMADLVFLENESNVSWQFLWDEGGEFTKSLPTGESDAVLLIDSTNRVSYSATPTASSIQIEDQILSLNKGGGKGISVYFQLAFGPCLFLLLLALPREGWVKPEEPLPPGALWGSIILCSGLGALLALMPSIIIAFLPLGSSLKALSDFAVLGWFLWISIHAARTTSPLEVRILADFIHSKLPESFSNWRDIEDLRRDVLLGFMVGMFTWMIEPSQMAQAVVAPALTNLGGIFFSIINLFINLLIVGIVVLFLRILSSFGGPFSRLFGKYGAEAFAILTFLIMVPILLWVGANNLLNLFDLGII